MIDQAGNSNGKTNFEKIEFTESRQKFWIQGGAFEILSKGYVVTGATLAIRKKICDWVFPVPMIIPELIHDGWISLYLAMDQKIGFLTDILVEYREHESQQETKEINFHFYWISIQCDGRIRQTIYNYIDNSIL